MPGASIELIGAEKVRRCLDRLVRDGQDATPLMRDIGKHVLNATRASAVHRDRDGSRLQGRDKNGARFRAASISFACAVNFPIAGPLERAVDEADVAASRNASSFRAAPSSSRRAAGSGGR